MEVTYHINEEDIKKIICNYFDEKYGQTYDWQIYLDRAAVDGKIYADIRVRQEL